MAPAEGIGLQTGGRLTDRWSDASSWLGEGLRREVAFFPSGDTALYGSLYAAAEPSRPLGVVTCNSWGVEADRCEPLLRSVALAMARRGGAGFVFHYPGYGDSYGDFASLDLDGLSSAAVDAVAEASRRCPGFDWILVGVSLGAAIACLARGHSDVDSLLLLQPSLRPGAYFRWLSRRTEQLAPGSNPRRMMEVGTTPGMVYGHPIPQRILSRARVADAAVASELSTYEGDGAVIRHEKPEELDPLSRRFHQVVVPGPWRFGAQNHPALAKASGEWLDRRMGAGALVRRR